MLVFLRYDIWILRQHDLGFFLHEGRIEATAIKEEYVKKGSMPRADTGT
jgi:hypothetical protein